MIRRILKKFIRNLTIAACVTMVSICPISAVAALSAQQVAQKTAALVSANKGLKATFTVTASGQSFKGSVVAEGNRFVVETPQISTWHDGKSLYTYNSRTNETTITSPTASELLESNPLLYVKNAAGAYSCSFAKSAPKGKYVIEMLPVNKRSSISLVTVTVNANTFQPERITVKASGQTSTVTVDTFRSGINIPADTFSYPKTKYPNAEIVDLR